MTTRHSIPLSCLGMSLAVVLAGCGSDYGGLLGVDGGGGTADAAADARADVPTTDASVQADTAAPGDSSTTSDQSSQPDLSTPPPDVSTQDGNRSGEASTPGDGSVSSDALGPSDGMTADIRVDGTSVMDAALDLVVDARIDTSVDSGVADAADAAIDIAPDRPTTGLTCGDGKKEGTEECDDGNALDFDGCSSICSDRRACICCVLSQDPDLGNLRCRDVEGDAEGGPKIGTAKALLCQDLYTCLIKSNCATGPSDVFLDCYCGAGNTDYVNGNLSCLATPRGACVNEFEAGLEAEGATWEDRIPSITARLYDSVYGGGVAGKWWTTERGSCRQDCGTPPKWVECPNPDPPGGDSGADAPGQ